jgi:hypothetical protein
MCDCLRRIDDAMIEAGNPTRAVPVLFLDGSGPRASIVSYVPEEAQPRAASGRIVRRIKPARFVATYCPWCGEKYPERPEAAS